MTVVEESVAKSSAAEILFEDPLSVVTRRERRFLLWASAVGIVIAKANIVPTKISALGVEFSDTNQAAMLKVIAAVVLYFLLAFLLYCICDLIRLRMSYRRTSGEEIEEVRRSRQEQGQGGIVLWQHPGWLYLVISLIRAVLFDFMLPIATGVYAVAVLLKTR